MKVLSLLQPWASLCVHIDDNGKALKQIETRSWNTKHRGRLLIHASAGKKKEAIHLYNESKRSFLYNSNFRGVAFNDLPFGAIIGCVDLVDTIGFNEEFQMETSKKLSNQELAFGDYSPNRYGWLLSNPILFREPIPCKGQLSIWNLPAELEPLVNRQIELAA